MMEHKRWILWLLFFVFGILSSLDDWLHYKIRNSAIIAGLIATATLAAWLFPQIGLERWFSAASWGALIGIALWQAHVWPAGDAKLFALLCSLLVLLLPPGVYPSARLFIMQITNTFIPAALILSAGIIFFSLTESKPFIKEHIHNAGPSPSLKRRLLPSVLAAHGDPPSSAAVSILIVILGIAVWEWCEKHFRIDALPLIAAALWFGIRFLRPFLTQGAHPRLKTSAACVVILAFASREFSGLYSWGLAHNIIFELGEWLILGLLFCAIDYYLEEMEAYPLIPSRLAPGMIISNTSMNEIKEKGFKQDSLGKLYPDGLTKPQARMLKYWCKKQGILEIKIYRTHPFAFWMFLGGWLTINLRTDLVNFTFHAMQKW